MVRKFKQLFSVLVSLTFVCAFAGFVSNAFAVTDENRTELERYVDVLRQREKDFANTKTDRYLIVSKGEEEINDCEIEKIEYEGIVDTKIDDFDGDGKEELLVTRVKTVVDNNLISLTMYAKSGDEIKNIAETVLTNHALSGDRFINELGYKKLEGASLIYFVANSDVTINADGYFWNYNSIRYGKDGFYALTEKTYMGTQMADADLQECANYVKADGINIAKFTGEASFSKYDTDIKLLCNISLVRANDNFYRYVDDPNLNKAVRAKFGEMSFTAY